MTPNRLQRDIIREIQRGSQLVAIQAGWASGKTSGLATSIGLLNDVRGGCTSAWVMDTYPRAKFVSIPSCRDWLRPTGWVQSEQGRTWTAPNGGVLWMLNYYAQAGEDGKRLEGPNLGFAVIDECQDLPPTVLERMTGRVGRDGSGPPLIICAGLPIHDAWWVRAAERHPRGAVIMATSHANADNLTAEWFDNARANLSPARYAAMVENRPMPPEGQVYSMFRADEWPNGNLVSNVDLIGRDCIVAADFGVNNPSAAIIVRDTARDVDVIVDDVQPSDVSVYEYAERVAARIRARGLRVSRVVGDPAGNARSATNKDLATQARLFVRHLGDELGVRLPPMLSTTEPERRAIPAGVLCLGRQFAAADGRRSLCVLRSTWERDAHVNARTIASCIQGYSYPPSGGNEPRKDGRTDHLMDALRYWAINLRWVDAVPAPAKRDLLLGESVEERVEWRAMR